MATLPPPRDPRAAGYSIALVCLGNICRSAMAEVVLEHKIAEAGLSARVTLDSSGTGDWHIGEPMDRRAAATLAAAGYDPSRHRSRLFESDWFESHDAILVMDASNLEDVLRLAPTEADRGRVLRFRELDPLAGDDLEVTDPWYGGQRGFDDVQAIVERTADAVVAALGDGVAPDQVDSRHDASYLRHMARMGGIAGRVEALLGTAVVATTPVAGGDVCSATRVKLSDGRNAFVKTRSHAPADFFAVEAAGLSWLGEATEGAEVPTVLAHSHDCLILSWVESGRPSADIVEGFARRLALTHASGAPSFGADADGYIGTAPLTNARADSWPEFFATRRVLPYLKVARDRGAISATDAAPIEQVVERIGSFAGPPEPPSRIHGDLWSGNVVWSSGGQGVLVDPAAHGGHRETDLAMLTLFGAPHLARLVDAYDEASPLADGFRERVPLHQLHPLLVHAVLFGGSYGARAGDAARSLLAAREVAQ